MTAFLNTSKTCVQKSPIVPTSLHSPKCFSNTSTTPKFPTDTLGWPPPSKNLYNIIILLVTIASWRQPNPYPSSTRDFSNQPKLTLQGWKLSPLQVLPHLWSMPSNSDAGRCVDQKAPSEGLDRGGGVAGGAGWYSMSCRKVSDLRLIWGWHPLWIQDFGWVYTWSSLELQLLEMCRYLVIIK